MESYFGARHASDAGARNTVSQVLARPSERLELLYGATSCGAFFLCAPIGAPLRVQVSP